MDERPKLDRRGFLLGSAGAVDAWAAQSDPRVQRYVPLGRTGMKVSDISFGSSRSSDPALVRYAFERGVNYFDSAESYQGGASEEAIGAALHDVRDRVFITSKTQAGARAKRGRMMRALEGSLKRLRTDYVDVYFNHAVNDVDRMRNEEWHEFTEEAKKQGKIRFRGMSGHGGRLVPCLEYALEQDLVDVILVAYNFGQDPAFHQKFTAGFDLYSHRLQEWKNSTPEMKAKYEEMKKEAQVEEYKFMERVLQQFDAQAIEQELRRLLQEIEANPRRVTKQGGLHIFQVKEQISNWQSKMVQAYQERQAAKLRAYEARLVQLLEKSRLLDHFLQMGNSDFYQRYMRRHDSLLSHREYLR